MNYFEGKTAIVTGGASGIGRGLCKELASNGARVIAADLDLKGVEATVAGITSAGGRAEAVRLDVTKQSEVEELVARTVASGGLDFMFNNAGIGISGEVRDIDLDDWRKVADVNYWGVVYGTTSAYKAMVKAGRGHIVNTASGAGLVPFAMSIPYTATKHAVVGLSQALRAEGHDLGVRVSVVCPGFIDTAIFRTSPYFGVKKEELMSYLQKSIRHMDPDKCARVILKGVKRNKAVITVTAEAKLVWWLYRLSPALVNFISLQSVRQARRFRE